MKGRPSNFIDTFTCALDNRFSLCWVVPLVTLCEALVFSCSGLLSVFGLYSLCACTSEGAITWSRVLNWATLMCCGFKVMGKLWWNGGRKWMFLILAWEPWVCKKLQKVLMKEEFKLLLFLLWEIKLLDGCTVIGVVRTVLQKFWSGLLRIWPYEVFFFFF